MFLHGFISGCQKVVLQVLCEGFRVLGIVSVKVKGFWFRFHETGWVQCIGFLVRARGGIYVLRS